MYIFYIIFIIFILLFILAIKWEIEDNKRIVKLKNVDDIVSPKEKEKFYKFLAKFPYENSVDWRMIYIISIFSILILGFVFNLFYPQIKINKEFLLLIFTINFITFYLGTGFSKFHFYRILASKADSNITII